MYCYTIKYIVYFARLFYTPAYGVSKKMMHAN
jgi:hypothetical protein